MTERQYWRLPIKKLGDPWPPFDPNEKTNYGALSDRFELLDEELLGAFEMHDREALKAQRTHRRYQLALIVGAAVTGFLGAIQAAVGDAAWVGFAVAAVGVITAAFATLQRDQGPMTRYLEERGTAEELRSLYFLYLGGLTDGDHRYDLRAAVGKITTSNGGE